MPTRLEHVCYFSTDQGNDIGPSINLMPQSRRSQAQFEKAPSSPKSQGVTGMTSYYKLQVGPRPIEQTKVVLLRGGQVETSQSKNKEMTINLLPSDN